VRIIVGAILLHAAAMLAGTAAVCHGAAWYDAPDALFWLFSGVGILAGLAVLMLSWGCWARLTGGYSGPIPPSSRSEREFPQTRPSETDRAHRMTTQTTQSSAPAMETVQR